jgi:hypothetical protein
VPACDVQLRDAVIEATEGCHSIYFTVPAPTGAILQATFDPGHEPSLEEFTLRKPRRRSLR